MFRYFKDIRLFFYIFIVIDKYELKYFERLFLVINIGYMIFMFISFLIFVLYLVVILGIVIV